MSHYHHLLVFQRYIYISSTPKILKKNKRKTNLAILFLGVLNKNAFTYVIFCIYNLCKKKQKKNKRLFPSYGKWFLLMLFSFLLFPCIFFFLFFPSLHHPQRIHTFLLFFFLPSVS